MWVDWNPFERGGYPQAPWAKEKTNIEYHVYYNNGKVILI